VRDAAGLGAIMWAIDFCAKRSSDCVQMAEECEDAERRRAWLDLAKEWVNEPVKNREYLMHDRSTSIPLLG